IGGEEYISDHPIVNFAGQSYYVLRPDMAVNGDGVPSGNRIEAADQETMDRDILAAEHVFCNRITDRRSPIWEHFCSKLPPELPDSGDFPRPVALGAAHR